VSNKKTGGPAFPRPYSKSGDYTDSPKHSAQDGMSMRDYFAAKAMQVIITNDEMIKRMERLECYRGIKSGLCIAKEAYTIADCMLEARND